jgi:hypothetical protein
MVGLQLLRRQVQRGNIAAARHKGGQAAPTGGVPVQAQAWGLCIQGTECIADNVTYTDDNLKVLHLKSFLPKNEGSHYRCVSCRWTLAGSKSNDNDKKRTVHRESGSKNTKLYWFMILKNLKK